jgi:uncharacterized protein (UPF0332 family)
MGSHADEIKLCMEEATMHLQAAREDLEKSQFDAAAFRAADSAIQIARALLWDEDIDLERQGDVSSLLQEIFVNGRRLTKEQGSNVNWLLGLKKADSQGSVKAVSPDEARRAVEIDESFLEAAKVILEG